MSKTLKPKVKQSKQHPEFTTQALAAAVQQIGKITGTDSINMRLQKNVLRVSGENSGRSYARLFRYTSSDSVEWEFSVAKSVLDQTLKGRKDLEFAVEDNRLKFSTKRFNADFATEPYNAGPDIQRDGNVIPISAEQQQRLLDAMQMVFMRAAFAADTVFCVDMSAKRTYIGCLDTHSAALVKDTGVTGALDFSMPSSSLKVLLETAGEESYQLCATGAALCAWNTDWEMTVPFVQSDTELGLEQAITMMTALGDGFVRCNGADFAKALETTSSVLEIGGDVDVEISQKSLKITGSSAKGRVSEKVEASVGKVPEASRQFKLDASSAINLLNRAPGEFVDIGVTDSVFFIKANDETTEAIYVAKLRS